MRKILLIGTGLLFALVLNSQNMDDKNSFEGWDANDDDKIDLKEYSYNTKVYNKWDDDGDNRISQKEFQESFFKLFDSDSDDEISMTEFQKASFIINPSAGQTALDNSSSQSSGIKYGAGTESPGTWDVNSDNKIDSDEFNKNITQHFNSWDQNGDNYISKSELYDNTFNLWDSNSDGFIDKTEFEKKKDLKDEKSFFERIF